jgi:hypothetical protein
MLSIVHEIPGRLRLRGPRLKGRPDDSVALADAARNLPGVSEVCANPLTGSLVVCYDPAAGNRDEIVRAVGGTLQQAVQPTPVVMGSIMEAIIERLLSHAARALVAAVI